jgi:hypothetical protein
MQTGSQQLSDPDHGPSLVPESRMKRRFGLCFRLGLGAMRVSITRRALFALLLAAIVSFAAGTMSAQSAPEASPVSLQQAASIALEKNPLRKRRWRIRRRRRRECGKQSHSLCPT